MLFFCSMFSLKLFGTIKCIYILADSIESFLLSIRQSTISVSNLEDLKYGFAVNFSNAITVIHNRLGYDRIALDKVRKITLEITVENV